MYYAGVSNSRLVGVIAKNLSSNQRHVDSRLVATPASCSVSTIQLATKLYLYGNHWVDSPWLLDQLRYIRCIARQNKFLVSKKTQQKVSAFDLAMDCTSEGTAKRKRNG